MMRKCLDCPRLIASGSRCRDCRIARRGGTAVKEIPRAAKSRDGGRCVICGSTDRVQAHHVTPLAVGGAHTLENMATLCHAHHLAAHKRGRLEIA